MLVNKDEVKNELLQQIKEKENKKKQDEDHDKEVGRKMAELAEKQLAGEEEFMSAKRNKAKEVMKKQWDEQLKLKSNEEMVGRIFV